MSAEGMARISSWRSLARDRMITSRSWPSLRGPIANTFGGSASGPCPDDQRMLYGREHLVNCNAMSTR